MLILQKLTFAQFRAIKQLCQFFAETYIAQFRAKQLCQFCKNLHCPKSKAITPILQKPMFACSNFTS
jgi:hypothetical protein